MSGYPPFNGPNDRIIMEKVSKGIYSFSGKEWLYVSKEAKRFIKKLLEYEPNSRYTAEQAINDQWIKEKGGDKDKPIESSVCEMTQNIMTNLKEFRVEIYWILLKFIG